MILILGTNRFEDCDSAIVIRGKEVFRLREGDHGVVLVDFDVRDHSGRRLAVVAKNQVVHIADGYKFESSGREAKILGPGGAFIASVNAAQPGTAYVYGTFHMDGVVIHIDWDKMTAGGIAMSGSTVKNSGAFISFG